MKIKTIKKVKSDKPIKFYDITTEQTHSFLIGDSKVHVHNSSLSGSLNKLARTFGNGMQVLDGYGFFGSEVSPEPAAARYTSVRLSKKTNDLLSKYDHLTSRVVDGPYDPFWIDIPLGLTTSIVGIAVGYRTTILSRNPDHIREYLEGKRKYIKPYIINFNGSIKKHKDIDGAWVLTGNILKDERKITIRDIPPILKYSTSLKKLDKIISKFEGKVRIANNSNTKVDITVVYTGNDNKEWDELYDFIEKSFSIIVKESPVFIKDGKVLVYDNVEQYLEDYKWRVFQLKHEDTKWNLHKLEDDINFNKAKYKFIEFIITEKRTDKQIVNELNKYNSIIKTKLDGLTSRKFSKDELVKTLNNIKILESEYKSLLPIYKKIEKEFNSLPDPTIERGIGSKNNVIDLFDADDISEVDGVLVWDGEDIFDKEDSEE